MNQPKRLNNRYSLIQNINQGAMGAVTKVYDHLTNREVAMKVNFDLSDPVDAQRFLQEAHIAAQIDHPHIVRVYDLGTLNDGKPFFTMELIDGKGLDSIISEHARVGQHIELPRVMRWSQEQASALDTLHDRGIIHRDYAPKQIIIDPQDHSKLTDFGLAKNTNRSHSLTMSQEYMGTPTTMAPEILFGERAAKGVDRRADVWSYGASLFELLTNTTVREMPTGAMDPMQMLIGVGTAPLKRLADHRPDLDDTVLSDTQTVLDIALAAEPGDRYNSAGAFYSDLKDALGPALHPQPAGQPTIAPNYRRRQQAAAIDESRRKFIFGGLAALGAVAIGGAGYLLGGSKSEKTSGTPKNPAPEPSKIPQPTPEETPKVEIVESGLSLDGDYRRATAFGYTPSGALAFDGIELNKRGSKVRPGEYVIKVSYADKGRAWFPVTIEEGRDVTARFFKPDFDPNAINAELLDAGKAAMTSSPWTYINQEKDGQNASFWALNQWTQEDQARFVMYNFGRQRQLSARGLHEILFRLPSDPDRKDPQDRTRDRCYFTIDPRGWTSKQTAPIVPADDYPSTKQAMWQLPATNIMRGSAADPINAQFAYSVPRILQIYTDQYEVVMPTAEMMKVALATPKGLDQRVLDYSSKVSREGITALQPLSEEVQSAYGLPLLGGAPCHYTDLRMSRDGTEYFERMEPRTEGYKNELTPNPDSRSAMNGWSYVIRKKTF